MILIIKVLWILFAIAFMFVGLSSTILLRKKKYYNIKAALGLFGTGALNFLCIYFLFSYIGIEIIKIKLLNNPILSIIVGCLLLFVSYVFYGFDCKDEHLKIFLSGLICSLSFFMALLFLLIPIFYSI